MNRTKHLSWVVALLLFDACALPATALEPANPKANGKARAILDYLERLPQRSDKRMLSGQFSDCGPMAKLAMCEEVHTKTGHWPAMIGLDYADCAKAGLEYKTVNRVAIEYARQGGLVTISAHLCNPANPKSRGPWERGGDLQKLLTPGNETYDRWMKQLDIMAEGLMELQDADVVALWRPFHEMNGDWFWWGTKEPETFIRLWRHMFDYFSKTKGLNNLLWVYSPNHGNKTADYYAGDRYVDIVGLDAYTDFVDPEHIRGYEPVARLPKPFGFTEFGPHGPHNPPGNYDYLRFLDGVQKHFPKTTFFLAWNGKWSLGRNKNVKQLLEHPWLVNREGLPRALGASNSFSRDAVPGGKEVAPTNAAAAVPPGAAALGYTKCVINESPTAADVAPGSNGKHKWFSGQWYAQRVPLLDHYRTRDGVLAIGLDGDLVSTPRDFSLGKLPLLSGDDGLYVEFDVRLSDNDPDHWPAVWLMPTEHDGKRDHYTPDPAGYERFMELDVDEGGFGAGLTGTVHSTEGVWPNWKHIQNPNNVSPKALDRSQPHTFGASYDPVHQKATWWVDGQLQMGIGSPYVPAVAARQHFYLLLSAQTHGAKKPYFMFVSGVRAYAPPKSSLPEK